MFYYEKSLNGLYKDAVWLKVENVPQYGKHCCLYILQGKLPKRINHYHKLNDHYRDNHFSQHKYGDKYYIIRTDNCMSPIKMFPNLDIFKKLYPKGELMNNYWVVL